MFGLSVAAAVGFVDAIFNTIGFQRYVRAGACMIFGLVGGFIGGFIGEVLRELFLPLLVLGWILAGVFIGVSVGVIDLARAVSTGGSLGVPIKKTINGLLGGFLGGFIGGVPFAILFNFDFIPLGTKLVLGLTAIGFSVGFLIGLAQVILKEAWLKVERGPRQGREFMLTKDETLIGRGESCDVGIFGDMDVDKKHARILLQKGRYVLEDDGSVRGTFLNDSKVAAPQKLVSGDLIRVGSCYLRFGERTKRK